MRNEIKKAMYQEENLPDRIQEENRYLTEAEGEDTGKSVLKCERELTRVLEKLMNEDGEEICLDVTYFLVFAAAQNPVCQEELKTLTPEQILEYQKIFFGQWVSWRVFLVLPGL